jgi:Cupredoxin-like domain
MKTILFLLNTFMILIMIWTGQAAFAEGTKQQVITIESHLFHPPEIHIPSHQPAVILIKNLDPAAEEFESAALGIEKVIPGKGEGLVHIRAMDHGHYTFVGEFHEKTARGVLIAD